MKQTMPAKTTTALALLVILSWSQQICFIAAEKFAMNRPVEMEINGEFVHLTESVMPDLDPDCVKWENLGECHWNHEYMFEHCIESCVTAEDFGKVGYFLEDGEEDEDEDEDEGDSEDCKNILDSDPDIDYTCDELAELGECHMNPIYMKERCARSCMQCLPADTKRYRIGVPQEILEEYEGDVKHLEETLKVITETSQYLSTKVMEDPAYEYVRRYCFNEYEYCASMAAAGDCEDSDDNAYYYFMMTRCAPACQACLTYELIETCTPDEEDNIFDMGDIDTMFRRIVGEESSDYEAVVHSSPDVKRVSSKTEEEDTIAGPWVVTLDNFLSDPECERLIELGERNSDDLGAYKLEELDSRISLNSWCKSECYDDPVTKDIMERMSDATGIPNYYSETLQMLKYSAGQKYQEHNIYDSKENLYESMAGPTVVTVLLFLNDVEEGGEIRFNDLSGNDEKLFLDILPKKGSALIWPSVQDDPSITEERTSHQFLPVLNGVKYGVKASFHLRSYDHDNCDYEAFRDFKWW